MATYEGVGWLALGLFPNLMGGFQKVMGRKAAQHKHLECCVGAGGGGPLLSGQSLIGVGAPLSWLGMKRGGPWGLPHP